ncbi:MAG: VWA domain-containing protein [bacterium]
MITHKHFFIVWIAILGLITWAAGCGGGMADANGGGSNSTQYNSNGGSYSNIGTSGAQDIGQFRSILESGAIPAANTLDANGFFSEHHTELPPPDCGDDICVHGMLAVHNDWVYGEYQAALQVAMNSPIDASGLERRPLDLVVVVDTSGSMADQNKMSYVKQGLDLLIDQLHEGDRMALVRYDGFVEVLSDLQEPASATALHALVNNLYPAGSTNFFGGLEAGLQMAADATVAERQSRVIMLSDGQPTTGITDDPSIIAMAEGYIADGVGLTTVGVGTSFNVELMRGLAERGAGNFYFLEDAEAIDEVFTEELNYFVTPIAYDLQIEVVNGAGYTLGEVVGTHLWTTDGYHGTIDIPAVFLASRTSQEDPPAGTEGRRGGGSAIIIELVPNDSWPELADPHEAAQIRMTYRLPGSDQVVEQVVTVANPNAPGVHLEQPFYTHQAIEKNHAMYNVFLGLRDASQRAETSHNHALWVLEQLEARASAWNAESNDEDIEADLMLIDQFMGNLREYGAWAVNPNDPNDPGNDPCYGSDDPYCNDPCAYGGCNDYYYEDDHQGGFFGCSTAQAADFSPVALALILLVLGGIIRRRRDERA